jgi:hypothetical protein
MIIAFCSIHFSERGTTVATYNYAHYNEIILKNKSIIIYQKNHPLTYEYAEKKFLGRFDCFTYENINDIENIVEKQNVYAIYFMKYGNIDNLLSKKCFNLIHSVFVSEPHGDIYAYISKYMNLKHDSNIPYVPYMIDFPKINENFRKELGISDGAVVFGCYGGNYSFNIKFVHECIDEIINIYPNIYFVFMNIDQNTKSHERIIYLSKSSDVILKAKFVNTCNAMIHARNIGETFGLACGEFSICGKPIITYINSTDKEHIRILGDKGYYYTNKQTLKFLFEMFAEYKYPNKNIDYNCYNEYTPEKIMKIFDKVFLEPIKIKNKIKVIVSRYNENIEWTKNFSNVLIYNKGNNDIDKYNPIKLPNVGREGHTYYKYIYDNYDNLEDYTIFLQGNPFDHSPNIINDIRHLLIKSDLNNDFLFLSQFILNTNLEKCHHHENHQKYKDLPLKETFEKIFGYYKSSKENIKFGAGAQFIVKKEKILQKPKEFYFNIIKLLEYSLDPVEGYVIERFHGLIFS